MDKFRYLVVAPGGHVVSSESTYKGALEVAGDAFEGLFVDRAGAEANDVARENPRKTTTNLTEVAMRAMVDRKALVHQHERGVVGASRRVKDADVLALVASPKEYKERLRVYVIEESAATMFGKTEKTSKAASRSVLGKNVKLEKDIQGTAYKGAIQGVQLMPFWMAGALRDLGLQRKPGETVRAMMARELGTEGIFARAVRQANFVHNRTRCENLCIGSVPACRTGCLVMAGQNTMPDAGIAKFATTMNLLEDPVLFFARLVMQIRKFSVACRKKNLVPFVRLNVFSDVVYEGVYPELFGHMRAAGVLGYDYTKLEPLRRPTLPDRGLYDLTLSYTGYNAVECREWMDAGGKVAVVFTPLDPSRKAGDSEVKRGRIRADELPETLWDRYPVVDGDADDFRRADPAGSVVALAYKAPRVPQRKKGIAPEERQRLRHIAEREQRYSMPAGEFEYASVVPVVEIEGRNWSVMTPDQVARQNEAGDILVAEYHDLLPEFRDR